MEILAGFRGIRMAFDRGFGQLQRNVLPLPLSRLVF